MPLPPNRLPVLHRLQAVTLPLLCLAAFGCFDRQTASTVEPARTVDEAYQPDIPDPAFLPGEGPVVCVDEAHNEFHSVEGTYRPFADVLTRDGYRLQRVTEAASRATLEPCAILVIPDAQPPARPRDPPTFSAQEVEALNAWVGRGGALFLITDHLPDPGAVADLAASFGIEVSNGYVLEGSPTGPARPILFRTEDGTLAPDLLLREEGPDPALTQVATFAGAALRGGEDFRPLLVFGPEAVSWMPRSSRRERFGPE
jgi:hypothetical protein